MNRVIAYFSALVLSAVAVAVGVRLVASNSSALDSFKGEAATTTTIDLGPAPAPGQVFVRGTIDRLTVEGAQGPPTVIAAPFTLTALERGVGKATIENALVSGRRTTIAWSGGTPLPISGPGGSIDLGGSKLEVDVTGTTWTVDGSARPLKPGTYRAGAPVAVGTTGVGTPRESVEFTADARTTINAGGGVVVKVSLAPIEVNGPGKASASGQLQIRDQTSRSPVRGFQFGDGPYTIKVNPVEGRIELDAVLQGPLTRS
ncbi:MAG: hypothetical protein M3203_01605 [Actinomycetota bacterium]|nr:hypothetical protein [Actinomycetota bacterium]